MLYTVISRFKDKNTKRVREVGDIVDLADDRAKEIQGKGDYIEKLVIASDPAPEKPKGKGKAKPESE